MFTLYDKAIAAKNQYVKTICRRGKIPGGDAYRNSFQFPFIGQPMAAN